MGKTRKQARIIARSDELKKARIEHGYNIPEFSRLIGRTKSMLYQVERGISGVSDTTAYKICQRLGLKFDDLFELEWPDDDPVETRKRLSFSN